MRVGRTALSVILSGIISSSTLAAVEIQLREREGADQAAGPPLGWLSEGRLGFFAANIATANADTSFDPEVSSSSDSTRFVTTFQGTLWWRMSSVDELEQHLQLRYGRSRTTDAEWIETLDVIEYDGVARHRYRPRRAGYAAVVVNSAFTGPKPFQDFLDPIRGAASVGHSWMYQDLQPLTDRLEMRAGLRAQKRWGKETPDYERKVQVGPEAYIRYQRKQTNEVSWWLQAEAFTEFTDVAHFQGLGTAALTLTLSKPITIDLRVRAYYEHHPNDVPDDQSLAGYDSLGIRQESLIGVTIGW